MLQLAMRRRPVPGAFRSMSVMVTDFGKGVFGIRASLSCALGTSAQGHGEPQVVRVLIFEPSPGALGRAGASASSGGAPP